MNDIAVAELTRDEARALTDDIKGRVVDLLPRIQKAFNGRADKALGYDSWHEYCTAELDDLRIPLTERPAKVAELRQSGMSIRAISSALGVGVGTVSRDLATVPSGTVPDRIVSLDGKERPATQPVRPEPAPEPDVIDDVPLWDEPTPAPAAMPARQEIADLIASRLDQVVEAQAKPAAPTTPDEARERDYQASSEAWSRNLAKCVYLLAGFSNLNGFVEKALKEWQPGQDIYPTKTTAERMRAAAAYLNAIAERWPA